jgi:hypothetical protein
VYFQSYRRDTGHSDVPRVSKLDITPSTSGAILQFCLKSSPCSG